MHADEIRGIFCFESIPRCVDHALLITAAFISEKEGSGNNLRRWLEFHEMSPVMAKSEGVHATPESLETYWR